MSDSSSNSANWMVSVHGTGSSTRNESSCWQQTTGYLHGDSFCRLSQWVVRSKPRAMKWWKIPLLLSLKKIEKFSWIFRYTALGDCDDFDAHKYHRQDQIINGGRNFSVHISRYSARSLTFESIELISYFIAIGTHRAQFKHFKTHISCKKKRFLIHACWKLTCISKKT